MRASTKSVIIFMVVYLGSLSILATWVGYLYYEDQKKSFDRENAFGNAI